MIGGRGTPVHRRESSPVQRRQLLPRAGCGEDLPGEPELLKACAMTMLAIAAVALALAALLLVALGLLAS